MQTFTIRNFAVVALAASAVLVGGASVAFAAPIVAQGPAPTCVAVSTSTGTVTKTFKAKNNCSYTVRVRFIVARHTDSDCFTLTPGATATYQVARTAALSGVDNC